MTVKKKSKVEQAKAALLEVGGKVSPLLAEIAPDLVQKMADKAKKAAKK